MINIKLNGEKKVLENPLSLYELVSSHMNGKEARGIAVALNENIIPKQEWAAVMINENDDVEIVHAIQGG